MCYIGTLGILCPFNNFQLGAICKMENEDNKQSEQELLYFKDLESIVNEKARELANTRKLHNLKFHFHLVKGKSLKIQAKEGPQVEFVVSMRTSDITEKVFWRMILDSIVHICPKLQRSSALEVRNRIVERRKESKKLLKLEYDKDESEVIAIIPRNRVVTRIFTRVEMTDIETNETVSLESEERNYDVTYNLEFAARLELSRRVMETLTTEENVTDNEDGNNQAYE